MNQHYIPKFYLKGFVDPRHKPHLWVFTLESGTWGKRVPKNTGSAADYYEDVERKAVPPNTIEKALGVIESIASQSLRKSIFANAAPNASQRVEIAYFISSLAARVPIRHEVFAKHMGNLTVARGLAHMTSRPDEFQKFKSEHLKEFQDAQLTDDEFLNRSPDTIAVELDQFSSKAWSLMACDREAPMFGAMDWTIVRAAPDLCFVTSDNPVAYTLPGFPIRPAFGGYVYKDLQITCPLSRDTALVARHGRARFRFILGNREQIEAINLCTALQWHKEIFAPVKEFVGADFFGGAQWMEMLNNDQVNREMHQRQQLLLPEFA